MEASRGPEPIAIIGLSCKLAGEADSPTKLWEMVSKGRDAWSQIPSSRFNWTGSYHADQKRLGAVRVIFCPDSPSSGFDSDCCRRCMSVQGISLSMTLGILMQLSSTSLPKLQQ